MHSREGWTNFGTIVSSLWTLRHFQELVYWSAKRPTWLNLQGWRRR